MKEIQQKLFVSQLNRDTYFEIRNNISDIYQISTESIYIVLNLILTSKEAFDADWYFYNAEQSDLLQQTVTTKRAELYPGSEYARPSLHSPNPQQIKSTQTLKVLQYKIFHSFRVLLQSLAIHNTLRQYDAKIAAFRHNKDTLARAITQACEIAAKQNDALDEAKTAAQLFAQAKLALTNPYDMSPKFFQRLGTNTTPEQKISQCESRLEAARQRLMAKGLDLAFFQKRENSPMCEEPSAPTTSAAAAKAAWD